MNGVEQKARDKAADLFQHYFKTAFEASGLKWTSDNDTEIEAAVQLVINAAVLRALDK